MKPFDLVIEPWIPCIPREGGAVRELNLRDALLEAGELREVYDNSPLVSVSLHRLLLAVLHRACGPATMKDWRRLWDARQFPAKTVGQYLERWRAAGRFDLFDEEHPFYQTGRLEMERASSVGRLALEIVNATIFDHRAEAPRLEWPPAEAARLLVAMQSFALGFGQSSKAVIGGLEVARPYSADAILLRGVTVWLSGQSLFETLMLNLLPYRAQPDDLPPWELDEPHGLMDRVAGGQRRREPARGPVDRYTWQSRLVRLLPETTGNGTIVSALYFTQGRIADKSPDDPMKAYARSKTEGWAPVGLSAHKAAWRDVHALLDLQSPARRRPPLFNHAARLVEDGVIAPEHQHALNVVGLATPPKKAGKFLLWRHDRMPVPAGLLRDAALVAHLGALLSKAEGVADQLRQRTRRVCRSFLTPSNSIGGRAPDDRDVTRLADNLRPERAYWARLELGFHNLLRELPRNRDGAESKWLQTVEREANHAFEQACTGLGTSVRALRAVAGVPSSFRAAESAQPTEEQTEEVDG